MDKLATFTFLLQIGASLADPEVQLPNGLIRGNEVESFHGTTFYAFEKIPYAAPPVGELRFKAPVPPSNWEEPLEMSYLDVVCYQSTRNYAYETEDCLYLKVFTPELPKNGTDVSLPVMLYIHGGGFIAGDARDTYSDRIIEQNIVLVIIHYRVGIFGFLSTQDEVIPGNNGLKDQQLAIKWTYDNIHLFGGDPNKITIFGQSAGSASCTYQLLNPANEGLIQGAILESGTFLSPWAFQRNAREVAFETASFLNETFKTSRDSSALLEFLQNVDAKSVDNATLQYALANGQLKNRDIVQGYAWAPVVEVENPDAFLTKKMYNLLQAGDVLTVPILIGMNSEESLSYSQDQAKLKRYSEEYDEYLDWLVPNDMGITDDAVRTEIGTKIRDIYTNGDTMASNLSYCIRFYSDTSFSRPIIKTAELHSKFAKTYFYQFSHDEELGHLEVQYEGAEHVGHSQEKNFIFCLGAHCDLSDYPEGDQVTSERIVQIWTNFAKYQNPTPEPSELLQNLTWPLVSTESGDFLYVDIDDNLEIRNHPKEATYSKWVELYDSLGKTDFDTY